MCPKELKAGSQRDTCKSVFIAALFTRAKRWNQPKHPSTHEQKNKKKNVYTVEYCTVFKKKEILTHSIPWMDLLYIMLSKIYQAVTQRWVPYDCSYTRYSV
jgi:hypothetical protein